MKLTNAEFMILQLICERKEVSGYEIVHLVKERGYKEWADIGTASIYVSLNKLNTKRLVKAHLDTAKQGKGPMPKKFAITDEGQKILRQEIISALSSSRERDYRFDLALAAISLVTAKEVVDALEQRKNFLAEIGERIKTIFDYQGGGDLPLNLQALFRHPASYIKCEIDFLDVLIKELCLPRP